MKEQPLRTTVIGSYPFPSWLEFASQHLEQFGTNEFAELQDDAVIVSQAVKPFFVSSPLRGERIVTV